MFSFLGLLGVVGMAGVVVNDSLVLVNYLCKSGQSRDVSALVAKGTAGLLCAILLTTVTTAAGLLPLLRTALAERMPR